MEILDIIHYYTISGALGLHKLCCVRPVKSESLCRVPWMMKVDDGDNEAVGEFERPSAERPGGCPLVITGTKAIKTKHPSLLLTIINHYQPLLTTINHY